MKCVCGNSRDWVYSDPYGNPYPRDFALCAICARNNKGAQLDVVLGRRVHVDTNAVADKLTDTHVALGGVPLNVGSRVLTESDREGQRLELRYLGHKTSVTHLSRVGAYQDKEPS